MSQQSGNYFLFREFFYTHVQMRQMIKKKKRKFILLKIKAPARPSFHPSSAASRQNVFQISTRVVAVFVGVNCVSTTRGFTPSSPGLRAEMHIFRRSPRAVSSPPSSLLGVIHSEQWISAGLAVRQARSNNTPLCRPGDCEHILTEHVWALLVILIVDTVRGGGRC